jgi:hypothetical protein
MMASEGAPVPSPGVTTGGTGSHNSVVSGVLFPCAKIAAVNKNSIEDIPNRLIVLYLILAKIIRFSSNKKHPYCYLNHNTFVLDGIILTCLETWSAKIIIFTVNFYKYFLYLFEIQKILY